MDQEECPPYSAASTEGNSSVLSGMWFGKLTTGCA